MPITFHDTKDSIYFEEVTTLFKAVGWGSNYYKTKERWLRAMNASNHLSYARDSDTLIAFGRILEDGIMCMFYEICVHPDYQRSSVGTTLMNNLIEKIKDNNYMSVGLFVWDGNKDAKHFYHKLGFEEVIAMEHKALMRYRADQ